MKVIRNYRDIGKTGVSFLTAFASGHTLDQDATGEGYLLKPGLFTNLLLPHNSLEIANEKISSKYSTTGYLPTNISILASEQLETPKHFTSGYLPNNINILSNQQLKEPTYFTIENYPTNKTISVNKHLGNTKLTYEVYYETN